ncbi:extracellular solute-binding protein [Proteinivorax hydrogeniformans]|uniref:Extracellular solute-binding protein n=1 Tax=Proteinivorax hydrogeniformans TaxID=1826727 RepID=A0AAU8HVI7_9FIRM
MKKSFSLLLIILLALPLAACGGDAEEENGEVVAEGIEATISVQVEEEWLEYYEAARDRVLADNPDATIEWIESPAFDHLDVLDSTDATNTDVADVFAIPADRIFGLNDNHAIAPIDAIAMAEQVGGFGDYDAGMGGNFNIDGEYLGFPMNIETLINFGNAANAEEAGIDLTETIEFTELDYEDMLVPAFDAWFGVALTNSADIEFLEQDASGNLHSDLTADFADLDEDKQQLFEALFNFWQAHNEAGTSMWDEDDAWGYMDSSFTTGGNTSIRLEGPWSTGNLSEQAGDGEDLVIFPMNQVTINGNPLAHWQSGWGMVANARIEMDEDKMLLAQSFMAEVVNPDYAVDFFKASGKIMENVEASVYMDSDLPEQDKEVISAVIESYNQSPARPLFTEWGQVWDTWKNGLLSWDNVQPETVEEAYGEIQSSFEAMMANF